MAKPRLLLFAERPDRGGGPLRLALDALGVEVAALSMRDCGFDIGGTAHGMSLPGFGNDLPDGVIVRFITGGSFEEVTNRLGILHALESLGVPVVNNARSIERSVDKAATSFHLNRLGLPTPRCWVIDDEGDARGVVAREASPAHPLVLKPLFGAQGRGLRLIESEADLPDHEAVAGLYYLQRFLKGGADGQGWRDMRVLVSGSQPVASMIRHGGHWITNIKQGGRAEFLIDPGPAGDLAVAAAQALGARLAGVDLIQDGQGSWQVLEVNSMPAWTGLQTVCPFDIAAVIAGHLLADLGIVSAEAPDRLAG